MVTTIANLLKDYGAVEFGEFTLASGVKSSYYIDIKTAATNPRFLSAIADIIAADFTFDVVAGVAVGAVPIAVGVSLSSGKPYAIVRSAVKEYGKGGAVIGNVDGQHVLLVEDVTTSGGSVLSGIEAIREAGGDVTEVVAIVDRQQGAAEALAAAGVSLHPLVRASDLLDLDPDRAA